VAGGCAGNKLLILHFGPTDRKSHPPFFHHDNQAEGAPGSVWEPPSCGPSSLAVAAHSSSYQFFSSAKNLTGFPARSFRQIRKSVSCSRPSSARIIALTNFA
jgi:hypothetical protein